MTPKHEVYTMMADTIFFMLKSFISVWHTIITTSKSELNRTVCKEMTENYRITVDSVNISS